MEREFGYYAVIPAKVLLDDSISSQAKLYYGAISCLANVKGYCWASNEYLGKLFGKDDSTARKCVASLRDAGYVEVVIDNIDHHGKLVGNFRKIYLTDKAIIEVKGEETNGNR